MAKAHLISFLFLVFFLVLASSQIREEDFCIVGTEVPVKYCTSRSCEGACRAVGSYSPSRCALEKFDSKPDAYFCECCICKTVSVLGTEGTDCYGTCSRSRHNGPAQRKNNPKGSEYPYRCLCCDGENGDLTAGTSVATA